MARNGSGIRRATDNSIQIEFVFQGERCRERIKTKPTDANLSIATQFRAEILAAIDDNSFDYAATFPHSKHLAKYQIIEVKALTVADWLKTWLNRKEPHIKNSTLAGYIKIIKMLSNGIGTLPLAELKKRHVRAWCETLPCSNKTIGNIISPLRAALQDAVDDELIDNNPLVDFRFRRNEAPKPSDVDPFNKDEQAAILSAFTGQHKNLFQFAFWSGLRTSELVALEWGDIDWLKETVKIQRAKTQTSNKAETTKTKSGTREVKLLSPALQALKDQKQFTFLEGKIVFHDERTQKPWTGDQSIRKLWTRALHKVGVRYRRPYQTRHTYASMMLSSGESLAWVSNQIGHSSVLMTASVYATYIPDSLPDAGNNAVNLFANEVVEVEKKHPLKRP
jgi:integrase